MSGPTPSGAAAPRMTLDRLAQQLSNRMVIHEVVAVGLVALSMLVIWSGPGGPVGTVAVLAISVIVIARVWTMPARDLPQVPTETATDPNAAAERMTALANRTMRTLQVPAVAGFVATIISGGWQPVVFGALISISGFTFFGPSRTRLSLWRDRMEETGGKTGL